MCVECLIGKQKKPSHDDELSIGISKWNLDSVSIRKSVYGNVAKHNPEETEEALDRSMARHKNTAPRDTAADTTHGQVACLRRKALVLFALPSRTA